MTRKRAIRIAEKWSEGRVCTLREGEAQEYHKMCLAALREQEKQNGRSYGNEITIVCDINKSKMTNADKVRAMSDEELANLLTDYSNNGGWITETGRQICYEQIIGWLQQPAKEDAE